MLDDEWSVVVEVKKATDKKLRPGILVRVNSDSRIVAYRSKVGRLIERIEGKQSWKVLFKSNGDDIDTEGIHMITADNKKGKKH